MKVLLIIFIILGTLPVAGTNDKVQSVILKYSQKQEINDKGIEFVKNRLENEKTKNKKIYYKLLHVLADMKYKKGDYKGALDIYNKLFLNNAVDNEVLNFSIALCNYKLGKYRKALEVLMNLEAAKLKPEVGELIIKVLKHGEDSLASEAVLKKIETLNIPVKVLENYKKEVMARIVLKKAAKIFKANKNPDKNILNELKKIVVTSGFDNISRQISYCYLIKFNIRNKKISKALQLLEELFNKYPKSPFLISISIFVLDRLIKSGKVLEAEKNLKLVRKFVKDKKGELLPLNMMIFEKQKKFDRIYMCLKKSKNEIEHQRFDSLILYAVRLLSKNKQLEILKKITDEFDIKSDVIKKRIKELYNEYKINLK